MKRRSSTYLVTITDPAVTWHHPAAAMFLAEKMQETLGVQSVICRSVGSPHAARDMRSARALAVAK